MCIRDSTSTGGVVFSNGMKVYFQGTVKPEKYAEGDWYVEGVGTAIKLVAEKDLEIPATYATDKPVLFDSVGFDKLPYSNANSFAGTKDYLVVNKASKSRNPWSRYNRWFHKAVIDETARIGGHTPTLDESDRAKRPIIEFDSGLALYNHGTNAKNSVTLFDTVTTDAFSSIVNQSGYIVDGISLADGMRVIFSADTDPIVKNKIYNVNFVHATGDSTITNAEADSTAVISLIEADDATPVEDETVFIEFGTNNQGKTYYYLSLIHI